METTHTNIGSLIGAVRDATGRTQQQVADLRHVARASQAQLETATANPSISTLASVFAALEATATIHVTAHNRSDTFTLALSDDTPTPLRWLLDHTPQVAVGLANLLDDGDPAVRADIIATIVEAFQYNDTTRLYAEGYLADYSWDDLVDLDGDETVATTKANQIIHDTHRRDRQAELAMVLVQEAVLSVPTVKRFRRDNSDIIIGGLDHCNHRLVDLDGYRTHTPPPRWLCTFTDLYRTDVDALLNAIGMPGRVQS